MKRAAFALVLVTLVACSDNTLRVIYEEAPLAEQPDALGPTIWVDEFQQRTVEASDILFVIDDSCSMEDEQEELAANFDAFIQHFDGTNLDFHIGVTKGDLEPGATDDWGILENLPDGTKWIDADTADPIAAFNDIANVGASGSGECEMGLQASFSALQYQANPGRPNDGFYREDALLTLVVVSDEIDHGADETTIPLFPSCDGIQPNEYIPWWSNSLKGAGNQDKLIWTGIVGDRPGGCDANGNTADEGEGYWDVIDGVGGNHLSVCSDDWSEFLTQLGFEAAGLKTSFQLRRIPLESTIVVEIDDEVIEEGTIWTYDRTRNAIDFPIEYVPEELSILRVTYQLQEDTGFIVPDDD
ncbi:MAG: hypothetical protein GY898_14600 [Proteobacteria bacterium]|nr:hypothetical protein [Pseudomonadota bacterium]